ncbi:hypothetical protein LTR62_004078 [Meristemomyces frigidus]|uniref:Uncharacterized protein n=1 Tax=Meristemomyces frigidus TaxID=1508187 RepID=A0AAN7TNQ3_9PEZI|nr:hypothetical protein LTR62_004078 [Meristemomyces frigidus]
MPRDGSGAGDNAMEEGQTLVHGAGEDSSIDRSSKAAPLPEVEKGDSIEGMNASGGGSSGIDGGSGKGPLEPTADKEASK